MGEGKVRSPAEVRHRRLSLRQQWQPRLGLALVRYYESGKLTYAGSVGTGWSHKLGRSIIAAVQRIARESLPIATIPRPDANGAHWAEPKMVCEVQFTEWTKEGRVRHPSFKGLREDKRAKNVVRELPS
jgi:bifunctional non-homologous end joining protein LigD